MHLNHHLPSKLPSQETIEKRDKFFGEIDETIKMEIRDNETIVTVLKQNEDDFQLEVDTFKKVK